MGVTRLVIEVRGLRFGMLIDAGCICSEHMHIRRAMTLAEQTGQPQFVGKDRYGHDVYLEPSYGVRPTYQQQGQMINPYSNGMCKYSRKISLAIEFKTQVRTQQV